MDRVVGCVVVWFVTSAAFPPLSSAATKGFALPKGISVLREYYGSTTGVLREYYGTLEVP